MRSNLSIHPSRHGFLLFFCCGILCGAVSLFLASTDGIISAETSVSEAGDRQTEASETALRLQRTWMPDVHPGSFAVGFPGGLNFCFDPVRNTLAYAWDGDYVDLTPTVSGKFPRAAEVQGTVFYKTSSNDGFSSKSPPADSANRFRGYRLTEGVPEFRYEVDGIAVSEEINPASDRGGLVRHFRVKATDDGFRYRAADPERVTIRDGDGTWSGNELQFPAGSPAEFSEFIPR